MKTKNNEIIRINNKSTVEKSMQLLKYCFFNRLNFKILSLKGCAIGDDCFKILIEGLIEKQNTEYMEINLSYNNITN